MLRSFELLKLIESRTDSFQIELRSQGKMIQLGRGLNIMWIYIDIYAIFPKIKKQL